MENSYYPFLIYHYYMPIMPFEPFIDEKTMYLHHDKHLQTYIDNLNAILKDQPKLQKLSLEQLIKIAGNLPKKTTNIYTK